MSLISLSPAEARDMMLRGARLIDIRGTDEYARSHIAGSVNAPLSSLDRLPASVTAPVIFHCLSGNRTGANAVRLASLSDASAYVLSGGLNGWHAAGFAVVSDRRQPIEIMRQVQIAAGSLVVIGVLLATFVAPAFAWLSAAIGAGLIFAGTTGWCGLARMLRHLPWNRRTAA